MDKRNYVKKLSRKQTLETFLLAVVWVLLTKIKIFSLVEIFKLVFHLKEQER